MKPTTANVSAFSVHRSFVVQFRAATDAGQGRVVGRIEHVASKQRAPFQSWAEIHAFIARVLMQVDAQPPNPP